MTHPVVLTFDAFGPVEEALILGFLKKGDAFVVIFTPTPSEKEQQDGR